MRYFLLLLTAGCLSLSAVAQTAEDSVKATINKLFDGFKKSDPAIIKSCFADSAILQTIANTKEGIKIMNENYIKFADGIKNLPVGAADERIVFDAIRIDGALASVWTPYQFYYNGNFLHCGVNSFQLIRVKGEWKIQYLIDTRRKQPCESNK